MKNPDTKQWCPERPVRRTPKRQSGKLQSEDKRTRLKDPAILAVTAASRAQVGRLPTSGSLRGLRSLTSAFLSQRHPRPTAAPPPLRIPFPRLPPLPFHLWKGQSKNRLPRAAEAERWDSVICGMPLVTELTLSQAPLCLSLPASL